MHQFRTKPGGFEEVRKRIITMMVFTFFIMLVFVFLPPVIAGRGLNPTLVMITVPVLAIGFTIAVFLSLRKQKDIYETYLLKIDKHKLVCERKGTDTVTIEKKDIKSVVTSSDNLVIKGGGKTIVVPRQVEGFEEIEGLLKG